jgi:hypothetical protein
VAAAATAVLLVVAACSSGGPGGGLQQITAVNLNTDGASPGGANSAAVAEAADAFLATLDPNQRSTVQLPFTDHQSRQTWSNYPSTQLPRKGIALSALSVPQREALTRLLTTALSPAGATQNTDIQQADDYLHGLGGQGAEGFGSLVDYFVAVYGDPSPTEPFAVQFGGHHLARNLTYDGDEVSQTPQFVGSEPTSFSMDGRTVAPVAPEADAMFRVVSGLTPEQRSGAQLSGTFDDLLVGPGKDTGVFPAPEGLPVTQLGPAQQQAVMAAIQAYAGDLQTTAADRVIAKYRAELGQTRVGWSNNTGPTDENSYVRIDGPSVWIEFINTRSPSTPNIHYHSVYRDKTDDYGSSTPH